MELDTRGDGDEVRISRCSNAGVAGGDGRVLGGDGALPECVQVASGHETLVVEGVTKEEGGRREFAAELLRECGERDEAARSCSVQERPSVQTEESDPELEQEANPFPLGE